MILYDPVRTFGYNFSRSFFPFLLVFSAVFAIMALVFFFLPFIPQYSTQSIWAGMRCEYFLEGFRRCDD